MSWENEDRMPNLSEVIDSLVYRNKKERIDKIKEQGIIVVTEEKPE
jgi:hypothetical protein